MALAKEAFQEAETEPDPRGAEIIYPAQFHSPNPGYSTTFFNDVRSACDGHPQGDALLKIFISAEIGRIEMALLQINTPVFNALRRDFWKEPLAKQSPLNCPRELKF